MTWASAYDPALLAASAQLVNVVLAFWGTLAYALLAARLAPSFAIENGDQRHARLFLRIPLTPTTQSEA